MVGSLAFCGITTGRAGSLELGKLRNPVWSTKDNLRDPSVLKVMDGYWLYYSRLAGQAWGSSNSWTIASVFTRDFEKFENDRDISPKGYASPGDLIWWHGRYVLPYQIYPVSPVRLCYSESKDLTNWSAPKFFLQEAAQLKWNTYRRVIDATFVINGEELHCYFVGSADNAGKDGKKVRANLMGHAVTRDPQLEKWEILSAEEPLIGWSERAPDGVENTMVIRTGEHWTMIYSEGLAAQHLALATSRDLRKWELEGSIELPAQRWMSRKFGAPFVWREEGGWVMILMGTNERNRTTFGLLSSPDGRRWKPLPEKP
jgi:sucrose-6-phosphate hydrolase SacC (GH32 family)